jgi:TnsA endonuclease N terminal/TnsA endonuclease C terminal
MPVRKIPKNYLFVTGGYSSQKNKVMDGFESLLEKEYLMLLDFDDGVESFEVQPVRIPVTGVRNGYVPDVLVKYRTDPETGEIRRPLLAEVKHSDDLERNRDKYAKKFAAAHSYAEERDWQFAAVDQTQIRTPRLANLKFLREYRNIEPNEQDVKNVLKQVEKLSKLASVSSLSAAICKQDDDRLHWLPVIWHMVLTKQLVVDLDQLMSNDTVLQLPGARV